MNKRKHVKRRGKSIKERERRRKEKSIWELRDNFKQDNIHLFGIPKQGVIHKNT